jgi:polyphosphate kinase
MISRVKNQLNTYLNDNTHAWLLQSDGSYQHLQPSSEQSICNAQALLLENRSIPLIEAS